MKQKVALVTGGAGFIGSHLVDELLAQNFKVVCLDKLTYAGSLDNIEGHLKNENFVFVKGCILDEALVSGLLNMHDVDAVFHLAAESHVDNSISGPKVFYETNVTGTFNMSWQSYLYAKNNDKLDTFRFMHISTDEVYGELEMNDVNRFSEKTPYAPNSPYSASKAGSDFVIRAMVETYKFPCIITNCSNNYGTRQNCEKLIPKVIRSCFTGQPIPIYGTGENIRDWLYVKDHAKAIMLAYHKGKVGETYCIGGNNEKSNISLVKFICDIMDKIHPSKDLESYRSLISFVSDRKGHDMRYAIDPKKAEIELGFEPTQHFEEMLTKTIEAELVSIAERKRV